MQKKIVLEFTFDEVHDEDDFTSLELTKIERTHSDLSEEELDALGEEVAQSDWWQVDNWNRIQRVLGGEAQKIELN